MWKALAAWERGVRVCVIICSGKALLGDDDTLDFDILTQ